MKLKYDCPDSKKHFNMFLEESDLGNLGEQFQNDSKFYTIVWNKGKSQDIHIDGIQYTFPSSTLLPIMMGQTFSFERPEGIVGWQFNREFYCVVDNDPEVGCVGFVFYGPSPTMFIDLDPIAKENLQTLERQFIKEFKSKQDIQYQMLRVMLVSLIISITRLAKSQYLDKNIELHSTYSLIRQFNLLVEIHFTKHHKVNFYAELLNKSPKTISNVFLNYSDKRPLQTIHERIVLEANRLLRYSNKSVKEVALNLGFEDVSQFSRMYKKQTGQSPSSVKLN